MSEDVVPYNTQPEDMPSPVPPTLPVEDPDLVDKPTLSMIWLLPIVALIIGIGMVYHQWQNRGIPIQITFDTAEGLVAGKTMLKNRNVDIGLVTDVGFNEDKSLIVVDIEVEKSMRDFLQTDSQFWVVRPRIGTGGVSGIGTLLTGAYIEVTAGKSGRFNTTFSGLESPPVTPFDSEGIQLTLVARGTKPLEIGNPVIYNGLEVGKVESFEFNAKALEARYGIFIHAPYHKLVTANTVFWNVSGLALTTSTQGFKIDVASLETLIRGGVQFDVPEGEARGKHISAARTFTLYDSKESVAEQRQYDFLEYVILVEESVGGLANGAPVEYRGIRIGTVVSPYMGYDRINEINSAVLEERIPVIVHIEPGRISASGALTLDVFQPLFEQWIKDGLTASIETGNLLTGSLKVSLKPDGTKRKAVDNFGEYAVIPAAPGGFANITRKLENVLTKLEHLPIEKTLDGVSTTVGNIDQTLVSLENTMSAVRASMNAMQTTMEGAQPDSALYRSIEVSLAELQVTLKGMQPNSALYQTLNDSLVELQTTLSRSRLLMQDVSNQPSSLIFGEAKAPDAIPQPSSSTGER